MSLILENQVKRDGEAYVRERERMKILFCIFSAFHSENASLVYS